MTRRNGAGTLTCPADDRPRRTGQYLCPGCWFTLPAAARTALNRRDDQAVPRLQELLDQLGHGVPLDRIEITP
ncbi:hypothetical protein [Streptomyces sp. NPDC047070]|uniref:hypothetical protein n=1 Tax=Streptomyces sp. NPDC047070 TaxID=3154923 RepID=UPI0034556CA3